MEKVEKFFTTSNRWLFALCVLMSISLYAYHHDYKALQECNNAMREGWRKADYRYDQVQREFDHYKNTHR